MAEQGAIAEPTTGRTWLELARAARHPIRFLTALVWRVSEDDIATPAAAMAYYFFFSMFPMLLFILALASMFPVDGLEQWILAALARYLPSEAYALIEGIVQSLLGTPRSGLLSIGAVLTLWTASSAFGAVFVGLNRAYRAQEYRPWWRLRLEAMGLTIGLSTLMIIAFVLGPFGGQLVILVTSLLGPIAGTVAAVLRWAITVTAVMLVVAAIYYVGPAIKRDWQWIRPGSVLFTLGFAATSGAFSFYVENFGAYDKTYGSLGAVIILLLWMYILALFLLLGGELNAFLEELSCGRSQQAVQRDEIERETISSPTLHRQHAS
jgi:membrane protein